MISALRSLGVPRLEFTNNGHVLRVEGCGGALKHSDDAVYLANAGTASRFLTAACCLVQGGTSSLCGNARMHERPIKDLVDALTANGSKIAYVKESGCLPLDIQGGGLKGGKIQLDASISSQYVSAIMIAAPYADE